MSPGSFIAIGAIGTFAAAVFYGLACDIRRCWEAWASVHNGRRKLADPGLRFGEMIAAAPTERELELVEEEMRLVREVDEFARTLEELRGVRFYDREEWVA